MHQLLKKNIKWRTVQHLFVALPFLIVLFAGSLLAQEQNAANHAQPDSTVPADTIPPDLVRAREALGLLEAAADSLLKLESKMKGKDDEEVDILRVRAQRYIETLTENQSKLHDLILKLESAGISVDDVKNRVQSVLMSEMEMIERSLRWWTIEINELRDLRTSTPIEKLGDLESRINEARDRLDTILLFHSQTLKEAEDLGMKIDDEWSWFDNTIKERAEIMVGRLQIAVKARDQLKKSISDTERSKASEADIGKDRTQYQLAKRRVDGIAQSLKRTADMLAERGYDSTQYRQFIIKTTGEVTERVLDPRILFGLVRDFLEGVWTWIKENAPTVFVKLLIVIAFVVLFRLLIRLSWWILRRVSFANMTRLMSDLVSRLITPLATLTGLMFGLSFIGVNTSHLLAGVGVFGIIVGLALQDSLSNLAAGAFILFNRPFDVDDIVTAGGVVGTVRAMGLSNTTIVTFDGRRLLIPNRRIWGDVIENRTAEPYRRAEITIGVGYDQDLDQALEVLRDLVKEDERVLATPAPEIFVLKFADSWLEVAVRPWVRNSDWWSFLKDLPRLVRLRFAQEGIDVPYPHLDVSQVDDKDPGTEPPKKE